MLVLGVSGKCFLFFVSCRVFVGFRDSCRSDPPACNIAPETGPMQGTSADDKEEQEDKTNDGQENIGHKYKITVNRKQEDKGNKRITRGQEIRRTRIPDT